MILTINEQKFIKQLNYWIKRRAYGVEHEGSIWIYNTLDDWANQLKLSKSSIRRTIQSLKQKQIIKSAFLSDNKRDRTLFYTIDYYNFNIDSLFKFHKKKFPSTLFKNNKNFSKNEHMVEHMEKDASKSFENQSIKEKNECKNEHIIYNTNINLINKSYKSKDLIKNNFSENNPKNFPNNKKTDPASPNKDSKPKNTTIQDMLKELHTVFPDIPVFLDKNLARNLVAAFKLKFKNSLMRWHEFLQLVKTSAYLMSEKFRLTIHWLLKFSTIDRLFQGDLGVKLKEFSFTKTADEIAEIERKEQTKTSELINEINDLEETENCKEARKKLLKKLGNIKYETWFKRVFLTEEDGRVIINISSRTSTFLYDYISSNFMQQIDSLNLICRDRERPEICVNRE